ncbi:MAG: hypothetical protein DHS20C17_30420 [Cyclobacteriaceae bacterium]|nr:MAG: hypothetical protein DHS20C17_30420 [Cyclobacteriaceae bacterium]
MDIVHYLQINSTIENVYHAISTSRGIASWWSLSASGHSELGAILELDFGPGYQWQAQVTGMVSPTEFELILTKADPDWIDSTVGFQLSGNQNLIDVRFYHKGWKEANDHYYTSCYCWAMYLRIMKRYVEHGETVDYHQRLDV